MLYSCIFSMLPNSHRFYGKTEKCILYYTWWQPSTSSAHNPTLHLAAVPLVFQNILFEEYWYWKKYISATVSKWDNVIDWHIYTNSQSWRCTLWSSPTIHTSWPQSNFLHSMHRLIFSLQIFGKAVMSLLLVWRSYIYFFFFKILDHSATRFVISLRYVVFLASMYCVDLCKSCIFCITSWGQAITVQFI